MNKKETIALWITGIAICLIFLCTPKKYIYHYGGGYKVIEYAPAAETDPALRWDIIIPGSVTALIIGGLLIYTLRDKKK